MIDQEDMLEIEAEDVGGTSPLASLLTTVFSQYGTGTYRFVARPHGPDPRRPSDAVIGATFLGTRPPSKTSPPRRLGRHPARTLPGAAPAVAPRRLAPGRARCPLVVGHLPPPGHRPPAGAVGATAGAAVGACSTCRSGRRLAAS